jgi:thiamine biosynthesis lipoprotein
MISSNFKAIFGWPLFLVLGLASCQEKPEWVQRQNYGPAQGSTYQISYITLAGTDYQGAIDSLLLAVDLQLSAWKEQSSLSQLNRGDTLPLQQNVLLQAVIDSALEMQVRTAGAFDITIGSVIQLWGFHRKQGAIPTDSSIALALAQCGQDKIVRDGEKIVLKDQCSLDVNGIAQGFTVDIIASFLEAKGIERYMVEVGGEVRAQGMNIDDRIWRIGIDRPTEEREDQPRFMRIVPLENKALATSGNYRKYAVDPHTGKKYGHSIDPTTGRPKEDVLLSATVIAPTATAADAWGTALMVMGLEQAQRTVLERPELEAYLIYSNRKGEWEEWTSPGFPEQP